MQQSLTEHSLAVFVNLSGSICKPESSSMQGKRNASLETNCNIAESIMHVFVCRCARKYRWIVKHRYCAHWHSGGVPNKSNLHIQEGTQRLAPQFKRKKYEPISVKCSCRNAEGNGLLLRLSLLSVPRGRRFWNLSRTMTVFSTNGALLLLYYKSREAEVSCIF